MGHKDIYLKSMFAQERIALHYLNMRNNIGRVPDPQCEQIT